MKSLPPDNWSTTNTGGRVLIDLSDFAVVTMMCLLLSEINLLTTKDL